MASNVELFGDVSSSSEEEQDDNEQRHRQQPEGEPQDAPAAAASTGAESPKKDDDAMEVDEEENKEPKGKKQEEDKDNDDEDDESDVEFDDQGAVVGLKSTTMAGSKLSTATTATANRDGGNSTTAIPARPERPRTLQVQNVDDIMDSSRKNNIVLHMTKLPNIVGIQTEPFDETTYLAVQEEEDFGQAAYNLIRWRYKRNSTGNLVRDDSNDDNKLQRESNTRLVEWEDGSLTLHVGDEVFQVDSLGDNKEKTTSFAGLNGYLYLSQTAAYKNDDDDGETKEEDKDPTTSTSETVLECMGPVHSRLAVRPSSLQSEAHKSLTVGIRQKTIKKARIAEFVTQQDPEKLKQERIKVKADLEKAAMRKKQSSAGYYRDRVSATTGGQQRRPRMSREYLEEDDRNFDTTNIRDMKRRTLGGDYEDMDDDDYGESSDEEDDTFHRVRPGKRKRKTDEPEESDEDEMFFDDEDEDEDDEEVAPVAKPGSAKKKKHQAVLDDDEDDD